MLIFVQMDICSPNNGLVGIDSNAIIIAACSIYGKFIRGGIIVDNILDDRSVVHEKDFRLVFDISIVHNWYEGKQ